MRHIVNLLAQSEIKVARHYYRRAYVAINRAQTTLNDYQNIAAVEEALIILIESYEALGLTQLKDDTIRVFWKALIRKAITSRTKHHPLRLQRVGTSFGNSAKALNSSGKVCTLRIGGKFASNRRP
jgi:outer membrane protein assembly factor BamD (BamD/ComL family)